MSQMRIWADAAKTVPVPFAKTLITPEGGGSPLASRVCDHAGTTAWDELTPQRDTPYLVTVEVEGFAPFAERYPNIFQDIDITLTRNGGTTVPPTPAGDMRLHTEGSNLVNGAGQRVLLDGATFFAAPWLVLERGHQAVLPSMQQLRDRYGVNCLVEFCMSVNVQRNLFNADPCDPSKYSHYWEPLGEHAERAAAMGMYLYLIAGPDHGLIPNFASQSQFRDFWSRLLEWARPIPNLILKPTNEGFRKDYNYVDVDGLVFPDFCPVAATDYGPQDDCWQQGTYPHFANWGNGKSCGDIHPPRTGTTMDARECIALNNVYYVNNRPLFVSEALRLGSTGSAGATREMARLIGEASNVGAAMRVFHSLQGEKCELFDDTTKDHADAYFTGK